MRPTSVFRQSPADIPAKLRAIHVQLAERIAHNNPGVDIINAL